MTQRDKMPVPILVWTCPKCQRKLAARQNRTSGKTFYGCRGYPECRYTCESLLPAANQRIAELVDEIEALRRTPASLGAQITDDDIKRMVFRWHPDRNPNGLDPGDVVATLLAHRRRK